MLLGFVFRRVSLVKLRHSAFRRCSTLSGRGIRGIDSIGVLLGGRFLIGLRWRRIHNKLFRRDAAQHSGHVAHRFLPASAATATSSICLLKVGVLILLVLHHDMSKRIGRKLLLVTVPHGESGAWYCLRVGRLEPLNFHFSSLLFEALARLEDGKTHLPVGSVELTIHDERRLGLVLDNRINLLLIMKVLGHHDGTTRVSRQES
mmetsp:Transcript_18393/g.52720  ORF Transcript_18393/g.52720 Transcript_18393/m.52720 type:complete len:204 (-) Transcript_18393:1896-2507(-)